MKRERGRETKRQTEKQTERQQPPFGLHTFFVTVKREGGKKVWCGGTGPETLDPQVLRSGPASFFFSFFTEGGFAFADVTLFI